MKETSIRLTSKKDLETIYKIEKVCFKDPYPLSFLEFLYNAYGRMFLVAENDGKIVGYIIASHEDNIGHIIAIAVDPLKRKKNIGRSLMMKALEIMKNSQVTTVRLEVRKSNIEAQKFYDKFDFKYSHTIDKYYEDEDGLVYFRTL